MNIPKQDSSPKLTGRRKALGAALLLGLSAVGAKVSGVFDEEKPAVIVKELDDAKPDENVVVEKNEPPPPPTEQPDAETPKLTLPPTKLPALANLPPTLEEQGIAFLYENWGDVTKELADLCQKAKAGAYQSDDLYKFPEIDTLLETYRGLSRVLREFLDEKTNDNQLGWPSASASLNKDTVLHTLDAICGTSKNGFEHDILDPLGKRMQEVVTNPSLSSYEKFSLLRRMNNMVLKYGRGITSGSKNLFDYGVTPESLANIGLGYDSLRGNFVLLDPQSALASWSQGRDEFIRKMSLVRDDPNISEDELEYAKDMIFWAGIDKGLQKMDE